MSLTLLQLAGAGTGGTQDALGSLDVPEDGRIVACDWAGYATFDATAENITAEVSFIATNTIATNDARGMISQVRSRFNNISTTGGGVSDMTKFVTFQDLDVSGGERLYLHLIAAAGLVSSVTCIIHLLTRRDTARRSRRRR